MRSAGPFLCELSKSSANRGDQIACRSGRGRAKPKVGCVGNNSLYAADRQSVFMGEVEDGSAEAGCVSVRFSPLRHSSRVRQFAGPKCAAAMLSPNAAGKHRLSVRTVRELCHPSGRLIDDLLVRSVCHGGRIQNS